jgi:hypothetical protein
MARSFTERLQLSTIALTHALTYALAVTAAVTAGALVLGVLTGGGLVHTKIYLFVAGWIVMAYAVVRLWPSDPSDLLRKSGSVDPTGNTIAADAARTRFQEIVNELPPVRWLPPPRPWLRLTDESKLFLGSLLILLTSFLMEVLFGIA